LTPATREGGADVDPVEVLEAGQRLADIPLREAVMGMHPHLRRVAAYHLGLTSAVGVRSRELAVYPTLALLAAEVAGDDPLPDDETDSLYQASNATGAPAGKTKPAAMTAATATGGNENGQNNYSFGFPIVGLRGRGMDLSLSLIYNSQVWHKSTDSEENTELTYDVDSDWPAPGFRINYGQIEDQGSHGFTLTDGDGTRHELVYTSANNYDTKDGSFIHFYGGRGWGTAYYPDDTQVSYGAAGGGHSTEHVAKHRGPLAVFGLRQGIGGLRVVAHATSRLCRGGTQCRKVITDRRSGRSGGSRPVQRVQQTVEPGSQQPHLRGERIHLALRGLLARERCCQTRDRNERRAPCAYHRDCPLS